MQKSNHFEAKNSPNDTAVNHSGDSAGKSEQDIFWYRFLSEEHRKAYEHRQNLIETIGKYNIILAPTLDLARTIRADATVEAEYGTECVPGRIVTLAHHGPRSNNPAPCNTETEILPEGSTIMLSHLDLDAVGGALALMGIKPEDPEFWKAAEFIDVKGPHHIQELPTGIQDRLNAINAWCERQGAHDRPTKVIDIKEDMIRWADAVWTAVDRERPGHKAMLEAGRTWHDNTVKATEACLRCEDEHARLFVTDGSVFCCASYYSPKQDRVTEATVQYNGYTKAVTLAFEDGGKKYSAEKIMQEIFGPEAGGRAGIAGSPRGKIMTPADARSVYMIVGSICRGEYRPPEDISGRNTVKAQTIEELIPKRKDPAPGAERGQNEEIEF